MQIILLQHVENLGRRGEVVRVAPGYARNFLLPRRMATLATPGARKSVEQQSRKFEQVDGQAREQATALAGRLTDVELAIAVKASPEGKLFGSVTTSDLQEALAKEGLELERKQIALDQPLKSVGAYEVDVKLHPDVRGKLKVNVVQE